MQSKIKKDKEPKLAAEKAVQQQQKEVNDKKTEIDLTFKAKKFKDFTEDDFDEAYENSEFIQHFYSLPKSQRPRLTKKQLIRMGQEKTAAEMIKIDYAP